MTALWRTKKCFECGKKVKNLHQSRVDSEWRCGAEECTPCHCGYCNGRANVHGAEAVRHYKQLVERVMKEQS